LFCVDEVDDEDDCPLPESEPFACCATAGRASHPLNASTATGPSVNERRYARVVAAVLVIAVLVIAVLVIAVLAATRSITF
jgi:hypothetical protein